MSLGGGLLCAYKGLAVRTGGVEEINNSYRFHITARSSRCFLGRRSSGNLDELKLHMLVSQVYKDHPATPTRLCKLPP